MLVLAEREGAYSKCTMFNAFKASLRVIDSIVKRKNLRSNMIKISLRFALSNFY